MFSFVDSYKMIKDMISNLLVVKNPAVVLFKPQNLILPSSGYGRSMVELSIKITITKPCNS